MSNKGKHNDHHSETDPLNFFNRIEVPYDKSKEEVWDKISANLPEQPAPKVVHFRRSHLLVGMAASLIILLGLFAVMRFYSKTISSPRGQHLSVVLPDGSTAALNAESTLKYKPLWWRFSRKIKFEGEGFFEVEKGRKFEVVSEKGKTTVLGTSFNIFSREDTYKVTCFTGNVKVTSQTNEEVILGPDYQAEVDQQGFITVFRETNTDVVNGWVDEMFSFTSMPLSEVLKEIERQYNIIITTSGVLDYEYTGFFSREKSVDEVLSLVSKPFGLKFVKRTDNVYEIIQN